MCNVGGATAPACNKTVTVLTGSCPPGQVLSGGQCITCPSCIPNVCPNGAVNYPLCNQCLPGKVFSGGQCITPPTPNACSAQCLGLDIQGEMGVGKTVTFTCNGSGGSTNQIWVYANGAPTPLTVLQGPVATYTFNSAGSYQAKCVIN